MKRLMVALLLALIAATISCAGPQYFNEARVSLTVSEVRSDSRYADMAAWFGLSKDVFTTHNGCVENIPIGSDGKFRWGQDMAKPYPWPAVTPQESVLMTGVTFDLGNGWFLHCQKGIDGNAIVFYGKYCLRQPIDGCDGKDGAPGARGEKGDKGDSIGGPRGAKGDKGDTVVGPRGPRGFDGRDGRDGQVLVAFPVQQMPLCGSAPPPTPNSVLVWTPGPLGGGGGFNNTKIVTNSSATGGAGGSVGDITNNNTNVNTNANDNTIAIEGTATGGADATGHGTGNSGNK